MKPTPKTTRVAIYCRVATQEQDDSTALDIQEQDCKAFCAEHGLTVVDVLREVASGTALHEREQLMAMRARYLQGKLDGIVIRTLDRLSRHAPDLLALQEEMGLHNATPHCVKETSEHLDQSILARFVVLS